MAKPAARIIFLEVILLAAGAVVIARSFWLQVVHHAVWEKKSENRRETDRDVRAQRGRILDRNGRLLAVSHEQYRVHVALNRVRDTTKLQAMLPGLLKVSKARVDDEFKGPNPFFNGPFRAEQIEPLVGMRGIQFDRVYSRQYPVESLADRILGRLDLEGTIGIEGMEKALDTLLRGKAGREHYLRDARGNLLPAPGAMISEPIPGHDVTLTIDADLQGIAEGALKRQVQEKHAHGGDIVIVNIRTGELLAVASLRTDTVTHKIVSTSSAIVEPNQLGSTSKIFTVAAMLLSHSDTTPVDGEGGIWMQPTGNGKFRRIEDVEKLHGPVTVGMTVRFSSNIAISKFALRVPMDVQYQTIRDFGFGTYPGLGFPGEVPGLLRRPDKWIRLLSQPSVAQGYEWEASSVQLALGYAAIANHGVLLAPTLVREVRDDQGRVTWRSRPDTVRHAVPDSIANHLMDYLRLTEDSGGTGAKGQLDRIKYPGKTGTAQVKVGNPAAGHRGSFVGIFPSKDPQIVVYVMIDRATGETGFGGTVAAPVVRNVLLQALLSTRSPLDRSWLTESVSLPPKPSIVAQAASIRSVGVPVQAARSDVVLSAVPAVTGQSAREAITTLERAGFQARLIGRAHVRATSPAAGDSLPRGAVVTIHADSLQ